MIREFVLLPSFRFQQESKGPRPERAQCLRRACGAGEPLRSLSPARWAREAAFLASPQDIRAAGPGTLLVGPVSHKACCAAWRKSLPTLSLRFPADTENPLELGSSACVSARQASACPSLRPTAEGSRDRDMRFPRAAQPQHGSSPLGFSVSGLKERLSGNRVAKPFAQGARDFRPTELSSETRRREVLMPDVEVDLLESYTSKWP